MSDPKFRLVMQYLPQLEHEDLAIVINMAQLLHDWGIKVRGHMPTNEHHPVAKELLNKELTKLKTKLKPKTPSWWKRKRKRKSYDTLKGSNQKKVWAALKQSSGGVTSTELATILDMPMQRVSAVLTNLYSGRHGKVLTRRAKVTKGNDGVSRRTFLYYYTPRSSAALTLGKNGEVANG